MKKGIMSLVAMISVLTASAQWGMRVQKDVPLDSIRLSDPAILADQKTKMYYMTGTGGMMWRSADLKLWEGPMRVTEFKHDSWMGPRPMIWAAELHQTGDGWYYYFATFTNQEVKIAPRRCSEPIIQWDHTKPLAMLRIYRPIVQHSTVLIGKTATESPI